VSCLCMCACVRACLHVFLRMDVCVWMCIRARVRGSAGACEDTVAGEDSVVASATINVSLFSCQCHNQRESV